MHIVTSFVLKKSGRATENANYTEARDMCSAVLLAELMDKVKNVFQNPSGTIYYWSDSKIALTWIAKPSHTWKTFVVFCKNSGVD